MSENSCRHTKYVGINTSLKSENNEDLIVRMCICLQGFNKVFHQGTLKKRYQIQNQKSVPGGSRKDGRRAVVLALHT